MTKSRRTIWLTYAICLIAAGAGAQTAKIAKPIILGESIEFRSDVLSENRQLNIYLPDGYSAQDTIRYPVIYLLDGGLDEDFVHVVGLVQFSTFPWVNYLQPSVIVGIANTDRKRDLTYPTSVKADKEKFPTTGGSEKFIRFLEQELQPFIERKYKTSSSDMLIGQSLAGLLAAEILHTKPDLFDQYIIISPSLWWDDGSLLNRKMVIPATPITIYLAVGKEGLGLGATPHVMEVDANLLADRLKALKNKNITLQFDYLPNENHATIMHQALLNAFRWMSTR